MILGMSMFYPPGVFYGAPESFRAAADFHGIADNVIDIAAIKAVKFFQPIKIRQ